MRHIAFCFKGSACETSGSRPARLIGFVLIIGLLVLLPSCFQRTYQVARVTPDAIHFNEPAEPLVVVGEPVPVKEEECAFQVPFFVFSRADVKRVIDNLFAEHEGDAIINAELYIFHLPLVIWDDSCVGIRGDMVRVSE